MRLIDANALLKEIEDWHDSLGGTMNPADWGIQNVLQSVMDSINEAEDVDAVEVVHGRWILERIYRKCSLCEWIFCIRDEEGDLQKFNYCPNCGMPMDGGAD